jgi:hypothetical protein
MGTASALLYFAAQAGSPIMIWSLLGISTLAAILVLTTQ